jgi:hypothetical protein
VLAAELQALDNRIKRQGSSNVSRERRRGTPSPAGEPGSGQGTQIMRLSVRQLAKINRSLAAEHNGQIEIDTAAPAGGSDLIEVLVTVRQSHVIRVPRTDAETYEHDVRRYLAKVVPSLKEQ